MHSMTGRTRTGAILTRKKPSTSRLGPNSMASNGPSSANNRSTHSNGTTRMFSEIGSSVITASKTLPSNKGKIYAISRTLSNSGRSGTIRDNVATSKRETRRTGTAYSRLPWQQHRSPRWESDHRNWRQRGVYRGYRIPEDRFRGRFGPEHAFRIYGLPFMVYRGYPRFQYGGYWITAVDPWPEYWGNDWYDNDDVYVTYVDDGYYMYNRRYPTVGIAIRISM
jgi:hypothetical protein